MHCMQYIIAEDHLSTLKADKLLQAEQNKRIGAISVGDMNVTQKAKLHLTSNYSVVCIHMQEFKTFSIIFIKLDISQLKSAKLVIIYYENHTQGYRTADR